MQPLALPETEQVVHMPPIALRLTAPPPHSVSLCFCLFVNVKSQHTAPICYYLVDSACATTTTLRACSRCTAHYSLYRHKHTDTQTEAHTNSPALPVDLTAPADAHTSALLKHTALPLAPPRSLRPLRPCCQRHTQTALHCLWTLLHAPMPTPQISLKHTALPLAPPRSWQPLRPCFQGHTHTARGHPQMWLLALGPLLVLLCPLLLLLALLLPSLELFAASASDFVVVVATTTAAEFETLNQP